jgi:hypothetical protein
VSRDDLVDDRGDIEDEKDARDENAQNATDVASYIIGPLGGVVTIIGCNSTLGIACYPLAIFDGFASAWVFKQIAGLAGYGAGDLGNAYDTVDKSIDANPQATSFKVTRTVTTQYSNDPLAPGEFAQTLEATFTIDGGGKSRTFSASDTLAGYNPFAIISSIFGF